MFTDEEPDWGFSMFLKWDEFSDPAHGWISPEGRVMVRVDVKFSHAGQASEVSASVSNLTEILSTHPGDVTLQFKDGEQMMVHSHIFALTSEPFRGAIEASGKNLSGAFVMSVSRDLIIKAMLLPQ